MPLRGSGRIELMLILLLLHGVAAIPETRAGALRCGLSLQVFNYPEAGHFFTDDSLQDHDAEAASKTWALAVTFLATRSK